MLTTFELPSVFICIKPVKIFKTLCRMLSQPFTCKTLGDDAVYRNSVDFNHQDSLNNHQFYLRFLAAKDFSENSNVVFL